MQTSYLGGRNLVKRGREAQNFRVEGSGGGEVDLINFKAGSQSGWVGGG